MDLGTARDFQLMAEEYDLSKEKTPPWLHEIKHDGFRVIARKNGHGVKLYSRPGNDLTSRFPLIVEALARLRSRSSTIDGEAVACGDDGIACFELIRRWDTDDRVFMWAFDLIELNGIDLRSDPLGKRKAKLVSILAREHLDEEDRPAGLPSCL